MKPDTQALETYFAEAASWDADRAARSGRSARIAWGVSAMMSLCAIASAIAVAMLSPLKTVEPFVIRVDNSTGIVDIVPVYTGTTQLPEAVTRYLLAHYVEVCERFNFSTAERDYAECGAYHGPLRNQEWATQWALANPQSPLNLYKDGTTVSVRVTSFTEFRRASGLSDLVQIRYVKGRRIANDTHEALTHWSATLQYAYAEPSKDPQQRRWNPLGLRVIAFSAEEDSGPEAAPSRTLLPAAEGDSR